MHPFIQQLIFDLEYRKRYILFKVQVEHRRPSNKLFAELPLQVALELEKLYREETAKWQRRQGSYEYTEAQNESQDRQPF
jgi:hypothetical protein